MNLSGTLSDWTVADLLSMLNVTKKTASLHVRGERTGTIHFIEGRVVGAALTGDMVIQSDDTRVAVADALLVLSGLESGAFELGPFKGPEGEGWEIEGLLSDLERLESLQSDLADSGLKDAQLMLREEVDQPVTIQTEDWWALASLVSVLSFDQLEEVFGRGRAIRLLHALWRMDLVEQLDEPVSAETEPILAEREPARSEVEVEIEPGAATTQPQPEPQPQSEPDEEVEAEFEPEFETASETESIGSDDDSWLDEIAAAAGASEETPLEKLEPRRVLGVSAPASTVLTGSVLDEMRRLRSHSGD